MRRSHKEKRKGQKGGEKEETYLISSPSSKAESGCRKLFVVACFGGFSFFFCLREVTV